MTSNGSSRSGTSRVPLTDGQKEQTKLTATYLNGIAIGLFLVGGLSIPTAILLTATSSRSMMIALAVGLFSVAFSPYVHWRARSFLKRLDR